MTPTIVFGGGHVGEDEEGEVLEQVEQQGDAAQAQVAGVGAVAALVVVPVGHGHEDARGRVQADAQAPHVALRGLAPDGRADGRQVVGHLQGHGLVGTGTRHSLTVILVQTLKLSSFLILNEFIPIPKARECIMVAPPLVHPTGSRTPQPCWYGPGVLGALPRDLLGFLAFTLLIIHRIP